MILSGIKNPKFMTNSWQQRKTQARSICMNPSLQDTFRQQDDMTKKTSSTWQDDHDWLKVDVIWP